MVLEVRPEGGAALSRTLQCPASSSPQFVWSASHRWTFTVALLNCVRMRWVAVHGLSC